MSDNKLTTGRLELWRGTTKLTKTNFLEEFLLPILTTMSTGAEKKTVLIAMATWDTVTTAIAHPRATSALVLQTTGTQKDKLETCATTTTGTIVMVNT